MYFILCVCQIKEPRAIGLGRACLREACWGRWCLGGRRLLLLLGLVARRSRLAGAGDGRAALRDLRIDRRLVGRRLGDAVGTECRPRAGLGARPRRAGELRVLAARGLTLAATCCHAYLSGWRGSFELGPACSISGTYYTHIM